MPCILEALGLAHGPTGEQARDLHRQWLLRGVEGGGCQERFAQPEHHSQGDRHLELGEELEIASWHIQI